jgi:hypothetical protein
MSGLKPPQIFTFHQKLRKRGLNVKLLAEQLKVSRPALTRVLIGSRRRGPLWDKVKPLLLPEEIELLDVALRHPWNIRRIAKRPRWAKVAAHFQREEPTAVST